MKKLIACIILLSAISFTNGQNINKTTILPEVVVAGEGNLNLLLIPCMGCRWNAWEEFMERNKNKYKMYAITIPGYGGTTAPNLPQNTEKTLWLDNVITGLSNLINQYDLKELVVVGHSWGTKVGIQLAAIRKDVIKKVIAIDGKIESSAWLAETQAERLLKAEAIVDKWEAKLQDAEEWQQFNGTGGLPRKDTITRAEALQAIKLVGSFMASDRTAIVQYWRENALTDLTAYLQRIKVPILNIQSFVGKNQEEQKINYLEHLKGVKAPSNVQSIFMFDTKHFIMFHRPLALDCIIENFLKDQTVKDFAPIKSEYFEAETMN